MRPLDSAARTETSVRDRFTDIREYRPKVERRVARVAGRSRLARETKDRPPGFR